MKKDNRLKKFPYKIRITNIGTSEDAALEAYIPAFNGIVYGEDMKELTDGILFFVESEIKELKKKGERIPAPDINTKPKGVFSLRMPAILHEQILNAADANGMSMNQFIVSSVKESFNRKRVSR